MNCVITTSTYTADEDFSGALKVLTELGDAPHIHMKLRDLDQLCRN